MIAGLTVRMSTLAFVQRLRPLVREAVGAEAGKGSVEEVVGAMSKLRVGLFVARAINVVLFVAIIGNMVLKPF